MTDHNEAMRLAEWLRQNSSGVYRPAAEAADLLTRQAERIAELEAAQAGIFQAITDPENQPSQYGTVTLDYLSDKLKEWERRYAKRDLQADKAEAERDTLRAEVERLRNAMTAPTIEPNSQNWAGMDGAIAFHLIERHADSWADAGRMMSEWREANDTARKATP